MHQEFDREEDESKVAGEEGSVSRQSTESSGDGNDEEEESDCSDDSDDDEEECSEDETSSSSEEEKEGSGDEDDNESSIDSTSSDVIDFKVTIQGIPSSASLSTAGTIHSNGDNPSGVVNNASTNTHIRGFSVLKSKAFDITRKRLSREYGAIPRLSYVDRDGDAILIQSKKDFTYVLRSFSRFEGGEGKTTLRLQANFGDGASASNSALNLLTPTESDLNAKASMGLLSSSQGKELIWQKGELIGSGSYGKVYRCIDSHSGEIIAVKEIKLRRGSRQKEQAVAMQQELKVLSTLEHPNIIRYLGAEYSKNLLRIFLELAPEGSIKDALNEFGPFGETIIQKYLRDILQGLAFLHSKRFVHRDIKPTNLLLSKTTVKLADFGCAVSSLADSFGKSAGLNGVIGTTLYMAPEVMGGAEEEDGNADITSRRYGRKADIWSLGLSVIEMATAEAPFKSAASAIYKVCVSREYPSLPDHCSAEAHSFIGRCLVHDPDARADCSELLFHPFTTNAFSSQRFQTIQLGHTRTDRHNSSKLMFNPLEDYHEFGAHSDSTDYCDSSPLKSGRSSFQSAFLSRDDQTDVRITSSNERTELQPLGRTSIYDENGNATTDRNIHSAPVGVSRVRYNP